MNIGIDARMLGPQQGGLGRYIQELISHLIKIDDKNHYVLFLKPENFNLVQDAKNITKIKVDIHWYGWKEQVLFPRIIKKHPIEIMHFPHWNVPFFYNKPYVVSIHDLLLLHYPSKKASTLGPLKYWCKQFAYKKVLKHAAEKSKHIISMSEYSKYDIHKELTIPLEKITITYQAPAPVFKEKEYISKKTLVDYKISKPYFLYVGVAYPHKNLEFLIRSWEMYLQKYGHDMQLVFAGKINYFYKKLRTLVDSYNDEKFKASIVFTDFVPDEQLADIFRQARAYVFPSLYEGFGLPPLEALSVGLPAVSSNRTCLPEVLGEAAIYFDPEDGGQMIHAMHRVATDEDVRLEILQKAKHELQRYSWERLAEQTRRVYEKRT